MKASTIAVDAAPNSSVQLRSSTLVAGGPPSGNQPNLRAFACLTTSPVDASASKCAAKRAMGIWAMCSTAKILEILSINVGASTRSRCVLRPAPCTDNRYACNRARNSVVLNLHQPFMVNSGRQNYRHDRIKRTENHDD